jgi:predicted acylesterase/phospholipase RssA
VTTTEAAVSTLVNGVFKGGGAKGVAYAGALKALREQDVWFGSVAGASAGAITATLIAAGLDPAEIEEQVPEALGRADGNMLTRITRVVLGRSVALFDSEGLHDWLETLLRNRTGRTGPVTFRHLYESGPKIELYVVVMDLATATPTVFSRLTTPDVEVAGAVIASCAIPGAFPAGRAVYLNAADEATVHQLVDGGSWANYPAFVFRDRSFRHWAEQRGRQYGEQSDPIESTRPTVGFVLGEPATLDGNDPLSMVTFDRPNVSRRFDVGPTFTSQSKPMSMTGAILGTDWCRAIIVVAVLLWMAVNVTLLPGAVRRLATWLDWVPSALYPIVFVGLVSIIVLAMAGMFTVIIGVLAISRMIADTVIPAGTAALGVATGVAPWAGQAADDVVVVVPTGGLSTTQFSVPVEQRTSAVDDAHKAVAAQLGDGARAGKLWPLVGRNPVPAKLPDPRPPTEDPDPALPFAVGILIAFLAALVAGMAGRWAANFLASTESWVRVVLVAAVMIAAVGFALGWVGTRSGARRARRARRGVAQQDETPSTRGIVALAVFGAAFVVAGIVIAGMQMNDRDLVEADVVASAEVDGGRQFEFVADELRGTLVSDRPILVGDDILVQPADDGTWTLAEPLPSRWFGISIAFMLFGIGLLSSGIKRWVWVTRCRRLLDVLDRAQARPVAVTPAPAPTG